MPQVFDKVKGWLVGLVELGLLLVALGIVLQILFGRTVGFITGDIVGNMILLIKALGDNGLVGLIALAHPRKGDLTEDNILEALRGAGDLGAYIDTALGYLRDGDDRRLVLKSLELIQAESLRCGNIVRDLLTYARQGTGEFRAASLHELVDQLRDDPFLFRSQHVMSS